MHIKDIISGLKSGTNYGLLIKIVQKRYFFISLLLITFCTVCLFSYHIWEVSDENKRKSHQVYQTLKSLFYEVDLVLNHCENRENIGEIFIRDIDPFPHKIIHRYVKKDKESDSDKYLIVEGKNTILQIDIPSFEKHYGVLDIHISKKNLVGRQNIQLAKGDFFSYKIPQQDPFLNFFQEKKLNLFIFGLLSIVYLLTIITIYLNVFLKTKKFFRQKFKILVQRTHTLEQRHVEQLSMITELEETLNALKFKNSAQNELSGFFDAKRSVRLEKLNSLTALLLEVLEKEQSLSQVKFLAKELLNCIKSIEHLDVNDFNASMVDLREVFSKAFSYLDADIKRKSLTFVESFCPGDEIIFETDPYLLQLYLICCFSRMIQTSFKGGELSMRLTTSKSDMTLIVERRGRGCADEGIMAHTFKALPFISTRIFENIGHLLGANAVFTHEKMCIQIQSQETNKGIFQNVVPLFA